MLPATLTNVVRISYLSVALSLWCCTAGCEPVPPEYKSFLEMSPQQQREQMEKLPVGKQIEYFLAGETYVHPPLRLGDYVAKRGKEAVPLLVERLKTENSAARKVDILYVLEDMNRYYYNLKDEKEALEVIRGVVTNINDPLHKPRAEQAFESIVGQQMLVPKKQ